MLPEESLREFKEIYQKEFGILLSDEEATEKATALLNVFKVFAIPKNSN